MCDYPTNLGKATNQLNIPNISWNSHLSRYRNILKTAGWSVEGRELIPTNDTLNAHYTRHAHITHTHHAHDTHETRDARDAHEWHDTHNAQMAIMTYMTHATHMAHMIKMTHTWHSWRNCIDSSSLLPIPWHWVFILLLKMLNSTANLGSVETYLSEAFDT